MPLEAKVGDSPLYFSGDALLLQLTILNGDSVGSPPLDLTPFTQITWVLAGKQGQTPIVTKTLGSGVTVVNAASGRVDVQINNADTATLKGTKYHEVQVEPGPNTVLFGEFIIQADSATP